MELEELIQKSGAPEIFLRWKTTPELPTSVVNATSFLEEDETKRVIFVFGNESVIKDYACFHLLKWGMQYFKKRGMWMTPTRIPMAFGEDPPTWAGVTVVVGIDMFNTQQARTVASMLRDRVPQGKIFILNVTSLASFEDVMGKPITDYLSNFAVSTTVESERPTIPGA